jgi:hypothetical protein
VGDTDEISQLILRERQGLDRGWWHRMRTAYASNATVALSWFSGSATEFIARSEQMAANGDRATHRLAPPVIDFADDRAIAEVPAAIEVRAEIGGIQADLVSYGRLLYRVIRSDGRWLLRSMVAIYERDTLVPVIPGLVPALDETHLAALRRPYQWFAYYLGEKGYTVDQDLPGDDRPDTVRAIYDEAFGWVRTSDSRIAPSGSTR